MITVEPHINDAVLAPERVKYQEIWQKDEYRKVSPGFDNIERFMKIVVPPQSGESLIDLGCGEGIAGLEFERRGLDVTYLDMVDEQLRPEVNRSRFINDMLWGNWRSHRKSLGWDYGYCVDVIEHVPTEYAMLTIDRIARNCRTAWLQIALGHEVHGDMIGKPLHLTVRTFTWWRDRIGSIANITDLRDLYIRGLFIINGPKT